MLQNLLLLIQVEVDEKHLIGYVGVFGGGSGSVLKYAKYIEFGTRKHFLPFDPMKYPGFVRWAIRKGLYKKGGGLIVGGYATPFMHFALAKNQPKIQASLRAIRGAV
jgi:dihydroxyacetone kinase